MITLQHRDTIPVSLRRRLEDLANRFPVGMNVRHQDGWTGRVSFDFVGNPLGLDLPGEAHCLITTATSAVCVEATINGRLATVWYRPNVLSPVGKAVPAPAPKPPASRPAAPKPGGRQRQRTRRAA